MKNNRSYLEQLRSIFPFTPVLTGVVFSLFLTCGQTRADDDYLRQLENELSDTPVETAPKDSGAKSSYIDELAAEAEATAHVTSGDRNDPAFDAGHEAMEKTLKKNKPTTYTFYRKLSPKQQSEVFNYYTADTSDGRLLHIQKKIMDIYFNR